MNTTNTGGSILKIVVVTVFAFSLISVLGLTLINLLPTSFQSWRYFRLGGFIVLIAGSISSIDPALIAWPVWKQVVFRIWTLYLMVGPVLIAFLLAEVAKEYIRNIKGMLKS